MSEPDTLAALRRIVEAAIDVDALWFGDEGEPIQWDVEAPEALEDLRAAIVDAPDLNEALLATPARAPVSERDTLAALRGFDARGADLWLSREALGLVSDGLVAVIAEARARKAANGQSTGDLRVEWAENILRALSPTTRALAAIPVPSEGLRAALAWALHNQVIGCKYTEAEEYYACPGPEYHEWAASQLVKDVASRLAAAPAPPEPLGNDKGGDYAAASRVEALLDEAVMDGILSSEDRRMVGIYTRGFAAAPAHEIDVERLARALACEDPEEPCDADGRDEHRWCDYCIARSVIRRPAIATAYAKDEP